MAKETVDEALKLLQDWYLAYRRHRFWDVTLQKFRVRYGKTKTPRTERIARKLEKVTRTASWKYDLADCLVKEMIRRRSRNQTINARFRTLANKIKVYSAVRYDLQLYELERKEKLS